MKKNLLAVAAVLFAIALSAFTLKVPPKHPYTTYFFQYNSTPGNEATPSNWMYVTSGTGCPGGGASCKVELAQGYVTGTSPNFTIDASALPSGLLPVVAGTGSNKVPDPGSIVYTSIANKH